MATRKKPTSSASKMSKEDELEAKMRSKLNAAISDEDEIEEEDYEEEDAEELEDDEIETEDDEESEDEEEDDEDSEEDDDEEEDEDEEEEPTPKKSGKVIKLPSLKDIKVDLNNIVIDRNVNDFVINHVKDEVFNSHATTQVVCCQSGYVAQLSALKNNEMQSIMSTDADLYNSKKTLYKYVHKHIEDTSIGKMGFEEFQKNTSYFDMETLLYGIYCQTFPYENSFNTQCNKPDCRKATPVMVNNNTLVEARGNAEDTFAMVNKLINAKDLDAKALKEQSMIHKTKRVILDDSKVIVDLVIPTLYDYLENTLKGVNPQFMQDYTDAIGMYLFVSNIFIPNVDVLKRTGNLTYIPIEGKIEKIMTLADLPYNDNLQLSEEITNYTDTYKISYSIKGARCQECGDIMDPIPVSIEEVLFRRISMGRQKENQ